MYFVASPITIGRTPVANGSKIPNNPAFFNFSFLLMRVRILFEVTNLYLLSKIIPLITNILLE